MDTFIRFLPALIVIFGLIFWVSALMGTGERRKSSKKNLGGFIVVMVGIIAAIGVLGFIFEVAAR